MIGLLIQVVLIVIIAGLALWVMGQFPVDPVIFKVGRVVIIVVAVLALVIILLNVFGGGSALNLNTRPLLR